MKYSIIAFFLTIAFSLDAQINIKVGYTLDFNSSSVVNNIQNAYNRKNTWLSKEFRNANISNGIVLGVRYKFENIALDIGVERVTASRTSEGINPENRSNTTDLFYRFNRVFAGLEVFNDYIGLGANLTYEQFQIRSELNNSNFRQKLLTSGDWGNKVYLIIPLPGNNNMGLSIQPYAQIPWTGSSVFGLQQFLGNPSNLNSFRQRNTHFGISLIIYNGKQ